MLLRSSRFAPVPRKLCYPRAGQTERPVPLPRQADHLGRSTPSPAVPWAKGFPTGAIGADATFGNSDLRSRIPRFEPAALKANLALVDLLGRIAARKGATLAQVALPWLLARKPWIVPVPGTTKRARFEENLGAASVAFDDSDLREIAEATVAIKVQGARYPEELLKMTGL